MFKKLVDRMFKKVEDVVYDITTNSLGVRKDNSIFSIQKDEDGSFSLVENLLVDFAQAIPAFAKSIPLKDVKEEDLILSSDGKPFGWVLKVLPKSLKVLKINGTVSSVTPSKVGLLGQGQTVMVVASLGQNGQIDPMMLMMLDGNEDMLPMMLMMQSQNNTSSNSGFDMNQMLPLLMMKNKDKTTKGSSSNSMMEMMLMQQMMNPNGQNSQINPMLLAMMMGK